MKDELTAGSSHPHAEAIAGLPTATRLWVESNRAALLATPVPIVLTPGQAQPRGATPGQLKATAAATAARVTKKVEAVAMAVADHRAALTAMMPSSRATWLHDKMLLKTDRYGTTPTLKFIRREINRTFQNEVTTLL